MSPVRAQHQDDELNKRKKSPPKQTKKKKISTSWQFVSAIDTSMYDMLMLNPNILKGNLKVQQEQEDEEDEEEEEGGEYSSSKQKKGIANSRSRVVQFATGDGGDDKGQEWSSEEWTGHQEGAADVEIDAESMPNSLHQLFEQLQLPHAHASLPHGFSLPNTV